MNQIIQKGINILLLGDSGVGKTALCQRYIQNQYYQDYEPTHMITHKRKKVKIDKTYIFMQLIDTKGMQTQRDFPIISQNIINSDGIFVMYDLTRKSTLEVARFWMNEIRKQMSDSHDFPVILLAAKYEQSPIQQISQDDCCKFSRECTTQFTVCSAKNNFNVEQIFNLMGARIMARRPIKVEKKSNQCLIY